MGWTQSIYYIIKPLTSFQNKPNNSFNGKLKICVKVCVWVISKKDIMLNIYFLFNKY